MPEQEKLSAANAVQPLVSVGIPTFNRPAGLRRTLEQILAQTYRSLEVIVSDNASPDPEVERVGREFAAMDERVRYVRQPKNIGAIANFKGVLGDATGDYFMWASDDDEWSPLFVENCLRASVSGESVGCKFDTLFRFSGKRDSNPIPFLDPGQGALSNVGNFLECMQPSLIYGLHKRTELQFFNKLPTFDFLDCYFVLHQILGPGMRTIPDVLYTAGVDAASYEIKHADAKSKKLDYAPFFTRSCLLLLGSRGLNIAQKFMALKLLNKSTCAVIRHQEQTETPGSILFNQVARLCLRTLGFRCV